MEDQKRGQPTASELIFVGSGPAADYAAEYSLTLLEFILKEEEVNLPGPVPGELSSWIEELFSMPLQVEQRRIQEHDPGAVQREVMREAAEVMANLSKGEAQQVLSQLGDVPPADMQRMLAALNKGNISAANQVRSEMVEQLYQKLGKRITIETLLALLPSLARCRAGRAGALCLVLYKSHPVSLIAQARSGNREAVLKLIKIDKLFLTDSCTAEVIRRAELLNDHPFLQRLARAVTYKPRITWRQGCRMYLYVLLSLGGAIPTLPKLQLRLDPDGTRFRTFGAFQKFVERSRKEFAKMFPERTDSLEKQG